MRVIQGPDLYSLHEQLIPFIVRNCFKKKDGTPEVYPGENGQDTIECKEFALFCKTPHLGRRFIPPPRLPFSEKYMEAYADQLINGKTGSSEFEYDYHGRLRAWGGEFLSCDGSIGIDQVNYIVNKLVMSPISRRAIGTTWYPHIDEEREDVPCLQLIHCDTREGKLNMKVVFRSECMLLGAGPNMYGLTQLQMSIANSVHLPCGSYTHVVFCPHLYPYRDEDYLVFNEDQTKGFVHKWW